MMPFIAALPMYDWPERRAEVDAQWGLLRRRLIDAGFDAPSDLVRRNGDLPPVPGGIIGKNGELIAPDPATLPPDELDLPVLWKHPSLLLAQTCWGPMELGLRDHVHVVGQDDYSGIEGGQGALYSSVLVMRRGDGVRAGAPADGNTMLPVEKMRGKRLAFNSRDSMSGYLALERDLAAAGLSFGIFSDLGETGGHRRSIDAVAENRADIAAIDCKSWDLALKLTTAARALAPVGWTARRKGLPFISSLQLPAELFA